MLRCMASGHPEGEARPGGGAAPTAGRRWVRALGWAVVGFFGAIAAAVALLPVHAQAAERPSVVLDRRGRVLATLAPGDRQPVSLSQIPARLQQATIATEDAHFYRDFGINPVAIGRAAWADLLAGRIVEGGSTITQQLAKNLYLTPTRTLQRKLVEALYTLRLQATHSKPEILDMYLNTVYYGEGAYGVAAAARTYFDRSLQQLDLPQCALLAGLPAAPGAYDPFLHPQLALNRRNFVLHRLAVVGDITAAQEKAAAAQPLGLHRGRLTPPTPAAGYFISYVLQQIAQQDPALEAAVRRGGYRILTTLSARDQTAADQAFSHYMPPGHTGPHGTVEPQGALVAVSPRTGAVRAMIGGRSYTTDPFNRATGAVRQPGSTFKPFLYATVVAAHHPVTARRLDAPVCFPGATSTAPYCPKDYAGYSYQRITMRQALADSVNVVAVKWAQTVGPAAVMHTAQRMGIFSPMQPTLPLALGAYGVTPLELASAYVPLANLGLAIAPWGVHAVETASGHVVWAPHPPAPHRVLDPGVAYIVDSLMESVMQNGTGQRLLPWVGRWQVAGKTGTTNGHRDAWFAGFTPNLVCSVWVGDDQPARMSGYGNTLAGPIWAHFMAAALQGRPQATWTRPPDVVVERVSAVDGLLPNPTVSTVRELFLRGTEPTTTSPLIGDQGHPIGLTGLPGTSVAPPQEGATSPTPAPSQPHWPQWFPFPWLGLR